MCAVIFYTALSETLFILSTTELDMIKSVYRSARNVSVIFVRF